MFSLTALIILSIELLEESVKVVLLILDAIFDAGLLGDKLSRQLLYLIFSIFQLIFQRLDLLRV